MTTTTNGGTAAGARLLRLAPPHRIMLLTAVMAVSAVTLFVVVVAPLHAGADALGISWVVWALAFGVSEAFPVHVQWRKDSHTFSMSDLVLAAGLMLATPSHIVVAQVVGVCACLLLHRRQRGLKLAFNTALFGLSGCTATTLFAVLSGPVGTGWTWVPALIAICSATVLGNGCIAAVISISEGRVVSGRFTAMCSLTVPAAVAAAAVGLVVARIGVHDPGALALLALPTVLIIAAYRAFTRASEQQDHLRVLHEVTSLLHEGETQAALGEFLASVRSAFRADLAELVLLGITDRDAPTLNSSRDGGEPVLGAPLPDQDRAEELLRLGMDGGALSTAVSSGRNGALASYATSRGVRDAIAAVLRTEDRVHGLMVIGGRHGEVSTFTPDDVTLLETFSRHVGTSLERGRLEETLRQVTDLKEQLRHQALHDALTDLPNRTLFMDRARQAVAASGRSGQWPAVLYLDLDGFKPVNDTHGHEAGDQLLRTVGDRLQNALRAGDTAARLGGDEFAVLLTGPLDEEAIGSVVDRVRSALCAPVDLGGGRVVAVGTSIGIAVGDAGVRDADVLVKRADIAMYTAKRSGGNSACVFREDLGGHVPEAVDPVEELRAAVEGGQLRAVYQPLIDLRTGQLTGAEALVRWEHPTDGVRMPDEFIGLADESGLIVPIGAQMLRAACAEAAGWVRIRPDLPGLLVTVNLSARQLASDAIVDDVRSALADSGLEPSRLVLEITETVLMHDRDAAAATLWRLKDLGVRIAIDDFGTGYSSLAYLRRFPIDMLKIAREFVSGLGQDVNDDVIALAIVELAETLGLLTVAEGVESSDQHSLVAALNCDLAQGFLFARPLSPEAVRDMVLAALPPAGTGSPAAPPATSSGRSADGHQAGGLDEVGLLAAPG